MSILDRAIADVPLAVIDLETTGLSANNDAICEIAVVRIDPGEAPRLVLDTLVDPQRRVTCSSIHGIFDEDVIGAPLMGDLIDPLTQALDGAVLAAFNVYFDVAFIEAQLRAAGVRIPLPHLCLMWMRPALALGPRGTLGTTCSAMGVTFEANHQAASDAMASASLWPHYLRGAEAQGVRTFRDFSQRSKYKFIKSWSEAPFARVEHPVHPLSTALKPRTQRSKAEQERIYRRERSDTPLWRQPVENTGAYWSALKDAIVDREVTPAELQQLRQIRREANLSPEALRFVHGKVFAGLIDEMTMDIAVDDVEMEWLAHVAGVLRDLGWAPGDHPTTSRVVQEKPESDVLYLNDPDRNPQRAKGAWWERLFS